ncbi:beta-1,4-galactosyltransferase galt-1 [Lepeophtheirus salmonis]|nr:beta-1,4-galactosyltransferase galt-1-like [Lepeophtheirus salmonis]
MNLSRRSLRLSRNGVRKFSPSYPKRQKLSFVIVITFFLIFGLIIVAEVLFPEEDETSGQSSEDIFFNNYDLMRLKPLHRVSDQEGRSNLKKQKEAIEMVIKNLSSQLRQTIPISKKTQRVVLNHKNLYSLDEVANPLDFTLRKTLGHDAVWQPVNGTSHKFYVYSAYFDNRGKTPVIRILAVTKTKTSDFVYCKMYYKDGGKKPWSITRASINVIRENWNLKYSASFVICNLGPGSKIPESVSVLSIRSKDPKSSNFYSISNQLPINEHKYGTGSVLVNSSDIGVCVKPLHFHYSKTLELVEFIELNRILGVTKFTFYNDTISSEVSCVLNHYKSEGSVNVYPWKLRMQSQKEIRTEGLFAALNDCLYRNMNYFKYLMLIDVDEFVIPRMNDTIPEMIEYLEKHKSHFGYRKTLINKRASAYSFQNSFFYLQFADEPESDSNLRVLRKTRRKVKFNPQKQRSKYICIPRDIKEAGNHFIWEFVSSNGKSLNVPTELGFLHHYRVCEFGGDDCINTPSVVDKTVYKYKDLLIKNVEKVFESLHSKCPSAVDNLIQDQKAQTMKSKKKPYQNITLKR